MLVSFKIRKEIRNKMSLNSDLLSSLESFSNKTGSYAYPLTKDFHYYLVMSQSDSYRSEAIEEILREKNLKMNDIDSKKRLFVLNCPSFIRELNLLPYIKESTFFDLNRKKIVSNELSEKTGLLEEKYYFTAIVSTDRNAISTLKLRLGFFEDIDVLQNQIQFGIYAGELPTPKAIQSIGFTGRFCLNPTHLNFNYCYSDPTLNSDVKELHPLIREN